MPEKIRQYQMLTPQVVTNTYARLMAARDRPISTQDVVDHLTQRGYVNPQTKKPITYQGVWWILSHPRNSRGRQLLEENRRRRANRYGTVGNLS